MSGDTGFVQRIKMNGLVILIKTINLLYLDTEAWVERTVLNLFHAPKGDLCFYSSAVWHINQF